ncbi:hypothetical protein ABK040_003157 [Willaertia magna]
MLHASKRTSPTKLNTTNTSNLSYVKFTENYPGSLTKETKTCWLSEYAFFNLDIEFWEDYLQSQEEFIISNPTTNSSISSLLNDFNLLDNNTDNLHNYYQDPPFLKTNNNTDFTPIIYRTDNSSKHFTKPIPTTLPKKLPSLSSTKTDSNHPIITNNNNNNSINNNLISTTNKRNVISNSPLFNFSPEKQLKKNRLSPISGHSSPSNSLNNSFNADSNNPSLSSTPSPPLKKTVRVVDSMNTSPPIENLTRENSKKSLTPTKLFNSVNSRMKTPSPPIKRSKTSHETSPTRKNEIQKDRVGTTLNRSRTTSPYKQPTFRTPSSGSRSSPTNRTTNKSPTKTLKTKSPSSLSKVYKVKNTSPVKKNSTSPTKSKTSPSKKTKHLRFSNNDSSNLLTGSQQNENLTFHYSIKTIKHLKSFQSKNNTMYQMLSKAMLCYFNTNYKDCLHLLQNYISMKMYKNVDTVKEVSMYLMIMINYSTLLIIHNDLPLTFEILRTGEEMLGHLSDNGLKLFFKSLIYNTYANYYKKRKKYNAMAKFAKEAFKAHRLIGITKYSNYFLLILGTSLLLAGKYREGLHYLNNNIFLFENEIPLHVPSYKNINYLLYECYDYLHFKNYNLHLCQILSYYNYGIANCALRNYTQAKTFILQSIEWMKLYQSTNDNNSEFNQLSKIFSNYEFYLKQMIHAYNYVMRYTNLDPKSQIALKSKKTDSSVFDICKIKKHENINYLYLKRNKLLKKLIKEENDRNAQDPKEQFLVILPFLKYDNIFYNRQYSRPPSSSPTTMSGMNSIINTDDFEILKFKEEDEDDIIETIQAAIKGCLVRRLKHNWFSTRQLDNTENQDEISVLPLQEIIELTDVDDSEVFLDDFVDEDDLKELEKTINNMHDEIRNNFTEITDNETEIKEENKMDGEKLIDGTLSFLKENISDVDNEYNSTNEELLVQDNFNYVKENDNIEGIPKGVEQANNTNTSEENIISPNITSPERSIKSAGTQTLEPYDTPKVIKRKKPKNPKELSQSTSRIFTQRDIIRNCMWNAISNVIKKNNTTLANINTKESNNESSMLLQDTKDFILEKTTFDGVVETIDHTEKIENIDEANIPGINTFEKDNIGYPTLVEHSVEDRVSAIYTSQDTIEKEKNLENYVSSLASPREDNKILSLNNVNNNNYNQHLIICENKDIENDESLIEDHDDNKKILTNTKRKSRDFTKEIVHECVVSALTRVVLLNSTLMPYSLQNDQMKQRNTLNTYNKDDIPEYIEPIQNIQSNLLPNITENIAITNSNSRDDSTDNSDRLDTIIKKLDDIRLEIKRQNEINTYLDTTQRQNNTTSELCLPQLNNDSFLSNEKLVADDGSAHILPNIESQQTNSETQPNVHSNPRENDINLHLDITLKIEMSKKLASSIEVVENNDGEEYANNSMDTLLIPIKESVTFCQNENRKEINKVINLREKDTAEVPMIINSIEVTKQAIDSHNNESHPTEIIEEETDKRDNMSNENSELKEENEILIAQNNTKQEGEASLSSQTMAGHGVTDSNTTFENDIPNSDKHETIPEENKDETICEIVTITQPISRNETNEIVRVCVLEAITKVIIFNTKRISLSFTQSLPFINEENQETDIKDNSLKVNNDNVDNNEDEGIAYSEEEKYNIEYLKRSDEESECALEEDVTNVIESKDEDKHDIQLGLTEETELTKEKNEEQTIDTNETTIEPKIPFEEQSMEEHEKTMESLNSKNNEEDINTNQSDALTLDIPENTETTETIEGNNFSPNVKDNDNKTTENNKAKVEIVRSYSFEDKSTQTGRDTSTQTDELYFVEDNNGDMSVGENDIVYFYTPPSSTKSKRTFSNKLLRISLSELLSLHEEDEENNLVNNSTVDSDKKESNVPGENKSELNINSPLSGNANNENTLGGEEDNSNLNDTEKDNEEKHEERNKNTLSPNSAILKLQCFCRKFIARKKVTKAREEFKIQFLKELEEEKKAFENYYLSDDEDDVYSIGDLLYND